ncbi:MFS transporter [Planotetraspora silvatica]|uniref:MFS transporter n=1 Tax=Planotetraspora silvatica TaxID=234614 RepID=A0A8J3XNP5_9ACTN|nr:MFS transporter [Planotetraspora silvatica]GII47450.1 MFS transporter [Planotetraspora silvatica]
MTNTTDESAEVGDDRERLRRAWRILSVVSLASVLTALGGSALNVALPQVVRQTHAGADAAAWILIAFQLTTTVLMVAFGRLADMFGRRTMYLAGLATYTLASLLAGLAPNAWLIVALRVLQAAGTAMLLTNSAALVTDAFPRSRLGEGMGVYTASFSIAQLVGPTVGGLFTEHLGWRWVFWYNVPIGLVCLVWGALVLPRGRSAGGGRGLDLPGNVLVLAGLGGLLLALSEVTRLGWGHPLVSGGLAVFVLALPLFVLREGRARHPVVDMRMFRDPPFALGTAASFLNSVARIGVVFLVSLFFQSVHGEDPVPAALKVLPLSIAAMAASVTSGFLQRRLSPRTVTVMGASLTTAGLAGLLCTISVTVPYASMAAFLVLIGLGSGLFLPSNTTVLLDGIPSNRLGIVNAMRLMLQNTGGVVGTAMVLSVITVPLPAVLHDSVFAGTLSQVSPAAVADLITGYRWTLGCMTAVAALNVLTCLGRRRATRTAPLDDESPSYRPVTGSRTAN